MATTKKSPAFRRQFDPAYAGDPGVTLDPQSLTVPSMSKTIKELLLNHSRNMATPVKQYEGIFTGEMEVPKFDDLFHAMEYRKELQRKQQEVEREIQAIRDAKRKEEADKAREKQKAAYRAEFEAEMAAKKGPEDPTH